MKNERVFKTKTGYCHILSDKIVLTRSGTIGEISETVVRNGISRILIIYGIISFSLLCFAFIGFKNGDNSMSLFYILAAGYLVYGIAKSINNSTTPVIRRDKIKNVKFNSAKTGSARAYFEIKFEDKNSKLKNRLIMLPGSLNDGKNETEKAVSIMKEENLI